MVPRSCLLRFNRKISKKADPTPTTGIIATKSAPNAGSAPARGLNPQGSADSKVGLERVGMPFRPVPPLLRHEPFPPSPGLQPTCPHRSEVVKTKCLGRARSCRSPGDANRTWDSTFKS